MPIKLTVLTFPVLLTALALIIVLSGSISGTTHPQHEDPVRVQADLETEPVPDGGDAADDVAIWIHPADPALSTIIGTNKKGGLAVYDLEGRQIQYLADGRMNNVDLRYNFSLGGQAVTLVTATNRTDDTIAVYKVDPETRQLIDVAARPIDTGVDVYGICMYRSPVTGAMYTFVTSEKGDVQQWALFDRDHLVDGRLVRTLKLSSKAEGCVADDTLAVLYVGEEEVGIWKYGAEPDDGDDRLQVDTTKSGGHLVAQVEGLSLYYAHDGAGYLIASSQGSDEFVLYQRQDENAYVGRFMIIAGQSVDGVSDTDGLEVTNVALNDRFGQGLLVVQDDRNTDPDGNQNFKLVSWSSISDAFKLNVDTSWNPRSVGVDSP